VCEEERASGETWFLVAESLCEDKLQILYWNDQLAYRDGVHRACCPEHVQELVTHWMTMGTLEYPFADAGTKILKPRARIASVPVFEEPDTRGVRMIGEISVHRESMERALEESPESLQIILDELADTLERASSGELAHYESAAQLSPGWLRPI
jgi:hypothetical protein